MDYPKTPAPLFTLEITGDGNLTRIRVEGLSIGVARYLNVNVDARRGEPAVLGEIEIYEPLSHEAKTAVAVLQQIPWLTVVMIPLPDSVLVPPSARPMKPEIAKSPGPSPYSDHAPPRQERENDLRAQLAASEARAARLEGALRAWMNEKTGAYALALEGVNAAIDGEDQTAITAAAQALLDRANAALDEPAKEPVPIPMNLRCPSCHQPHVDLDEWATRPHRTHLCAACGATWRPANVATVGVELLAPTDPTPREP